MKKLFVALGLALTFGLLGTLHFQSIQCAKAEDVSEVVSEETSELASESTELESLEKDSEEDSESEVIVVDSAELSEAQTIYENISNTAKDVLNVIVGVLEQPIVIAGVSTTLGVLIILVISKLISVANGKKLKDCLSQIETLKKENKNYVSSEDYQKALHKIASLDRVIAYLVDNTKNIKVREKAKLLLKETIIPKFEEVQVEIKAVNEEIEEKVEVVSNHLNDNAKQIIDIVNKD